MFKYLILSLLSLVSFVKPNIQQNYVCTTYAKDYTIDYYSHNNIPQYVLPSIWKRSNSIGYCSFECSPCEEHIINNKSIYIGYSASCIISNEDEIKFNLYKIIISYDKPINYTTYKPQNIVMNPLDSIGIFESNTLKTNIQDNNIAINKYVLCVYTGITISLLSDNKYSIEFS